jgi:tetratricopeptide (TPR) repeat protein
MELKQPTMAIEMYQRAVDAFADSPLPRYSLGKAFETAGKSAEAAKVYEEAVRIGHLPSLQQLINLQLSEKIALAPEHFAKLCLLGCEMTDFKDPWFNQTMAISHAQRGQLDEALGILHRAADLAREQGQNQLLQEIEGNIELLNSSR